MGLAGKPSTTFEVGAEARVGLGTTSNQDRQLILHVPSLKNFIGYLFAYVGFSFRNHVFEIRRPPVVYDSLLVSQKFVRSLKPTNCAILTPCIRT
ncbi:hypothetical protein A0J61_11880, partial [Choanephora cucurbitarum]